MTWVNLVQGAIMDECMIPKLYYAYLSLVVILYHTSAYLLVGLSAQLAPRGAEAYVILYGAGGRGYGERVLSTTAALWR